MSDEIDLTPTPAQHPATPYWTRPAEDGWQMTEWVLVSGWHNPATGEVELRCDGFATPWSARGMLAAAIADELFNDDCSCDEDSDTDAC